ncbi:adenosylcobalamin-dependent ribonucleoside-diphosphate reductase [Parasphingorhabdus sp.]|uniref:adenosylcobalamin-dependent ribonucleoside-diphosphate reductase n=1 Tax=Parasphingorhabdus sp. TaxID=2709688 RepID=UPI0032EBF826
MKFSNALAREIWDGKYRFNPEDDRRSDKTVDDMIKRVSRAVAEAEAPKLRQKWAGRFAEALTDFRFIPGGRILAGAGTERRVTLFNCFVMGTIPDSLDGIFAHLGEAAKTMQQGGGVGMDFSTIRPKGSLVVGVASDASGPLSFMDCWDSMCSTVMSAGQRRGAMMGCMHISHPDIEEFIDAKHDRARLRNFNLSVLVSDAFMQCLAEEGEWPLIFDGKVHRTVAATDLWERLMRSTYDTAEPGVIFVDRVNQQNNLEYCETISASNPCGEQMLPPYGACLLGSINLAALVEGHFTDGAQIEDEALVSLVTTAVRFLDNVIDISLFPLPQQEAEANAKRRIGLGITGLADALLFCGKTYGSDEAADLTRHWLGLIKRSAYRASAALAEEKGRFPDYAKKILKQPGLDALDAKTRNQIKEHGLRNGCLTSIAPTGTTSLLAGNVSSGIEPVFAYSYNRRILNRDGSAREEKVEDYAMQKWRDLRGDEIPPPDLFVSAQDLAPSDHLKMLAAAQQLIDSSISKTINCPEDIDFESFADVYVEGYRLGCKGMTTYRPNAITGAVLSVDRSENTPETDEKTVEEARLTPLAPRKDRLTGATYKLKWPHSAHAVYITINDLVENGKERPFEIFINSKNMEHYAWTLGLTRMISAVFRRGGDVAFVHEELKAVFDPGGGSWIQGRYVPSLLAAIGSIIERHMQGADHVAGASVSTTDAFVRQDQKVSVAEMPESERPTLCCKQCGSLSVVRKEGCDSCLDCGYSKCG